jgi:beta-xylosidase
MIEFRPCVIFNNYTQQFVMWYESRSAHDGSSQYNVAVSPTPQGPFQTTVMDVKMDGSGRIGDYYIFVDDDEFNTAYHVRTGFVVQGLSRNYTASSSVFATFATPKPSEAPIMFKRDGLYYIITGTGCCACRGGSTVYVVVSEAPLGPYEYLGEFGSNQTHAFDPHSPYNYVTRSQPTSTFVFNDKQVFLGNQWVTASEPGQPRNQDLLFWTALEFTANGNLTQLQWQDEVEL